MAYSRYRPHIHRTRIKVQWRISVVFTECLQAKRSLSINISPARGVPKKARNFLGAKSPFFFPVPLFCPYGTNSDSSNNYSNNRSYGFSLFTAAPPRQRASPATKLLTEMRIIKGWTWQFSYSSLSKYMYRPSHLEASNASGECGNGCGATSK